MKLSILTATYNRGKYLQKLYDSIKENLKYNQNCEWIIVDDGSTDDTKTFVKKFKDENIIPIIYYYQKNNYYRHCGKRSGKRLSTKTNFTKYGRCNL